MRQVDAAARVDARRSDGEVSLLARLRHTLTAMTRRSHRLEIEEARERLAHAKANLLESAGWREVPDCENPRFARRIDGILYELPLDDALAFEKARFEVAHENRAIHEVRMTERVEVIVRIPAASANEVRRLYRTGLLPPGSLVVRSLVSRENPAEEGEPISE